MLTPACPALFTSRSVTTVVGHRHNNYNIKISVQKLWGPANPTKKPRTSHNISLIKGDKHTYSAFLTKIVIVTAECGDCWPPWGTMLYSFMLPTML